MNISDYKKYSIPVTPGVYFFKKGSQILYIGKATSLKERTSSYFLSDLINTRGPAILDMINQANKISYQETESVLEALILESSLIKKYQPKYNVKEKDNKSYSMVLVTDEKTPMVQIIRERELESVDKKKIKKVFGPFPSAQQLKIALKIIRKIFPYYDEKKSAKLNIQIGLIPDPETTNLSDYKKNIKNVEFFFEGKKKKIISGLRKDMLNLAKKQEFEKANLIKKQIFALEHLNDVALIDVSELGHLKDNGHESVNVKLKDHNVIYLESYDISHLTGKNNVGAMVVMRGDTFQKKLYKKFNIKMAKGADDLSGLAEILNRRLKHLEWRLPNIIVIDGGKNHKKVAERILHEQNQTIPVVAVLKNVQHKPVRLLGDPNITKIFKKQILKINAETHRFVLNFHRQKRAKDFIK